MRFWNVSECSSSKNTYLELFGGFWSSKFCNLTSRFAFTDAAAGVRTNCRKIAPLISAAARSIHISKIVALVVLGTLATFFSQSSMMTFGVGEKNLGRIINIGYAYRVIKLFSTITPGKRTTESGILPLNGYADKNRWRERDGQTEWRFEKMDGVVRWYPTLSCMAIWARDIKTFSSSR